MKKLYGYTRVSTREQGKNRNGLEAQADDIRRYAATNGYEVVEINEEVRTGEDDDRPVLAELKKRIAKVKDAYLVVSKLDRLSRDSIFILTHVRDNPRFIVTGLGEEVDPFTLHIYAGLAEMERKMISDRTRSALKAKKARGEALGASDEVRAKAQAASGVAVSAKADAFANKLKGNLSRMKLAGMTFREMAEELNKSGVKTARGGIWYHTSVRNVMERCID